MSLVPTAFYTEVSLTLCTHGVLWHWLWSGYARYTAICHRTVTKPLMLLYECKVLLVSSICFFPTNEWTLVLDNCKGEPEFLLWVIFLCPLLYAGLRLLHLTVAQILYTIISYLYRIYLLLKFLLTCFNWIQHSVWQLWLLQSPHCQIQETTNSQAYTCDLVLGVTFYSPRSRMRTFRVKMCAAARACFSVHSGIHKFPRKYERRDNISERSNSCNTRTRGPGTQGPGTQRSSFSFYDRKMQLVSMFWAQTYGCIVVVTESAMLYTQ